MVDLVVTLPFERGKRYRVKDGQKINSYHSTADRTHHRPAWPGEVFTFNMYLISQSYDEPENIALHFYGTCGEVWFRADEYWKLEPVP